MWSKYFVIFSGFLLLFGIQKSTCARSTDHQFPLGTIGCLFVDKDTLCGETSRCIDDFLFGTCAGDGVPENFAYTLNKHDLKKLGIELTKLKDKRLSWLDGYTQCIIQNVILSLSFQEPFSKQICYNLLTDWERETENEIASIIQELEGDAVNPNLALPREEGYPMSRSQKRDEIIRVHKYFDKSKAIHKRLMEPESVESSYLSYYPKDDLVDLGLADPQYYPQINPHQNEMGWEDSGLLSSDFQRVRDYLEANRGRDLSTGFNDVYEPLLRDIQEGGFGGYYGNDPEDDLGPGYEWNDNGEISEMTSALAAQADEDHQESLQEGPKDDSLPPYYANLLDKLVIGEAQPENLTDDELGFLLPFVTKILARMSDLGLTDSIEEEEEVQKQMEEGEEEIPLQMAAEEALEAEMKLDPNSIPYGTEEEDMSDLGGVNNLDDSPAETREPMENLDLDLLNDELVPNTVGEDDTVVVKKNDELSGPHEAVKKSDVINTNIVYIEMDHQLTDADADKMMEVVEKDLKANPGALENYIIEGNTLKINVDSILAGVNAQQVAKQADTHRLDIEKATGYKFLGTGIGDENTIEYKGSDDRYFVLTFVLCGCIAGILLAVVVIYLIKRNTRSKEKLQQIATVEGNDAASKDYQDLCRQRMQSKSSEKPEPLHAASRISSVSESQVRSPSSRSSTSSWSEEPVNSNMDISTGHIVLSYMEDHLKNKDRLDREWEAMCAYEADPSSTKVAEDQANMRKNRYGDVLPYDHSRVMLQSSTNVSGSDYINASSITDHDPRNPAYIATQGPLPHTVADFWQMVWEQGSVVIVMLSKLTEDGEAKCHRYWPEEGSDLYHIYEVHLVSEHIWCEDYLVRSFYLKNLQTSETRTVTQFHFLTWPDLGTPGSIKALLDFRRKVNKSYRGRSCPIVVHCSDGCGRTGTYSLIDMVLNRMAKGAKEIDIAATLEHIRDQRMNMVKTKEQFQFALAAVAEEVHAILKALPQ